MKAIFHIWGWAWAAEKSLIICFIFSEQNLIRLVGVENVFAKGWMISDNAVWQWPGRHAGTAVNIIHRPVFVPPRPCVAEPERWQDVERSFLVASIVGGDFDQDIILIPFGIFDEDVEVAIVGEHAGVEELIFIVLIPGLAVGFYQISIRELNLRVAIEHLHVAMGRSAVQVIPQLFGVFSMVPFRTG